MRHNVHGTATALKCQIHAVKMLERVEKAIMLVCEAMPS